MLRDESESEAASEENDQNAEFLTAG